jgi:23S rRNA (guanosine2251-2'-O)-methyltransferase
VSSSPLVYGINPVLEALRAGRVSTVQVAGRVDERVATAVRLAEAQGVQVHRVSMGELDRETGGARHQGLAAELRAGPRLTLDALIGQLGQSATPALLVVLDGVEDPQNLGAIIRSVDAAGAQAVIRQTRRAAPLGGAAAKASAGAAAHVQTVDVVNVARALEELKQAGIWVVGLAAGAPARYDQLDYTLPTAVVVGAEGAGLRRLVRERCDWVVSIPMRGHVESLNASVAAAVILFEAVRQRAAAPGPVRPRG